MELRLGCCFATWLTRQARTLFLVRSPTPAPASSLDHIVPGPSPSTHTYTHQKKKKRPHTMAQNGVNQGDGPDRPAGSYCTSPSQRYLSTRGDDYGVRILSLSPGLTPPHGPLLTPSPTSCPSKRWFSRALPATAASTFPNRSRRLLSGRAGRI